MDPWKAVFIFRDNNGLEATCGVYLPGGLSVVDAIVKMNTIADAMQGVSNASLYAARLEADIEFSEVNPPEIDSDVMTRLIAVYRSEVERYAVAIPSPRAMPYDVGGSLRAIRLGYQAAQVSGLLTPLQSLLAGSLTPWGSAAPNDFVVAGISRGVL